MLSARRAVALCLLAGLCLLACGGSLSTLRSMGKPSGDGPCQLELTNESGRSISQAFVAPTEKVRQARASGVKPGSTDDAIVWGEDQLGRVTLRAGSSAPLVTLQAGRYDILLFDPDGREQLVQGLKLQAGGRYALEVGTAWRQGR